MRVIVCGAGQVGSTIARHLASEGLHVTVIDLSPEQVRRIDESYDVRGIVGHAAHPGILERAGAHEADMLIAVTRSDEVNMVACQVAYSLFGVKRRIARLRHAGYLAPDRRGLYAAEHLPIDIIISPEIEVANGIFRRLHAPGTFDVVALANGQIQLLGIHCDTLECELLGRPLIETPLGSAETGMRLVTIIREGKHFVPDATTELQHGDDAYVLARTNDIDRVMQAFGHKEQLARRVVIVGGGNVGLHLARRLKREAPSVSIKIIELDRERANYAATQLGDNAIVLHGDALDKAMMEEASIASAETIVAVTNDDETNIFASVLAKREGCPRAITLVNKRSYEPLMPALGIDAVVSPSAISISTVLRHVRHGPISALYSLREDFGEVIEAEIVKGSKLLARKLGEIGLPAGMIIGAVARKDDVFIPTDDTVLGLGDHIIALVTYASLAKAEALLGARGI